MLRLFYSLAMLLIVLLALALRLPNLSKRPLHNDEGVNTVKFDQLRHGEFRYDPHEYHGPTLYYFTLPLAWISGEKTFEETTVGMYRLVPVIFGIGLILLLPLVNDGLGRGGVLWAALFTAVSPAFAFYSRYYIHEMPLVFFAFAAIACGWRYRRSNRLVWAAACGVFIGLTFATKETWVLALAAAAGSAVTAATIWRLIIKGIPHHHLHFRKRAVAVGFAAFVIVFFVFFSGFFTQMTGPLDAIAAYFNYSGRASGSIHDEPWNYYLSMLLWWKIKPGPVWTEAAIVILAIAGFLLAVLRKHVVHHEASASAHAASSEHAGANHPAPPLTNFPTFPPFVRFIGFYTIFLTFAFSFIPYKTPWCLLGFLQGMILLAGFACGQIIHLLPNWLAKALSALIFLAAATHLAYQADRATSNFADAKHPGYFEASRYNPYVYAHTGTDIFNLVKRIDEVASVAPEGKKMAIGVIATEYWPLPFYLRHYSKVGYPTNPQFYRKADVIIGTADDAQRLAGENANPKYVASQFGLRPGVLLWVYVRQDLWEKLQEKWRLPASRF
jgi:uncharacterized protein (TIGR03663 family)